MVYVAHAADEAPTAADEAPPAADSRRHKPKDLFMQRVGSPLLLDGILPDNLPTTSFRILLAEDDFEFRRLLASTLRADGYYVAECANGRELLEYAASDSPKDGLEGFDVIISDIRMPTIDALSILEGIREWKPSPPWILITAFGDAEIHAAAERLGVFAFFDKPFDLDDLRAAVGKLA